MQTSKEFLRIFLDMGEALLSSGAEIFRVEDTLNRMGYACGATQMNVFVIDKTKRHPWPKPRIFCRAAGQTVFVYSLRREREQ